MPSASTAILPRIKPGISQPILFDHIAKTGGTTLHALLKDALGAAQCSPIITGSLGNARAEFAHYRCVSGHIFFHPMTDVSDLWTFTVLRDPVDRVLSHLNYSRHDLTPSADAFSQRARALNLVAYVESEDPAIVGTISNTMVAHFAPLAWNGMDELTPDRQLALAKEALARFNLVGLTERMHETADLLCWALGSPPLRTRQLNVSSRRSDIGSLPAASRVRLQRLNELDSELYVFASELHDGCRRRVLFGNEKSRHTGTAAAMDSTALAPAADPQAANFGSREVELVSASVFAQTGRGETLLAGELATARIVFHAHHTVDDLTVGLAIKDDRGRLIFATNTRCHGQVLAAPAGADCFVDFVFRADIGVGRYVVGASLHPTASHVPKCYHWVDAASAFDVAGNTGWHFDGTTKLNPTLLYGGVSCHADPSIAGSVQQLARIAPPVQDFTARIEMFAAMPLLRTGQSVTVQVDVANLGPEAWPSLGERSVRVSYHWLTPDGAIFVADGERTYLPRDIAAGESISLWANVRIPDAAGDYRLQLSLVQESVAWLEECGGRLLEVPVTVVAD